MGFLDSIVKGAARRIIDNVVDDVVDDVMSNFRGGKDNNRTSSGDESSSLLNLAQTIQFQSTFIPGVPQREFTYLDTDKEGNEIEVVCHINLPVEFIDTGDSGAMEIDRSYTYSPEDVEFDCVDDPWLKPSISIGDEDLARRIVNSYLKDGRIPEGKKLAKLENCFAKFRTEMTTQYYDYITYHYYRPNGKDILYQISLGIPIEERGLARSEELKRIFEYAISTYTETVK